MILDIKELNTMEDLEQVLMYKIDKQQPSLVGVVVSCILLNLASVKQTLDKDVYTNKFIKEDVLANPKNWNFNTFVKQGHKIDSKLTSIWKEELYTYYTLEKFNKPGVQNIQFNKADKLEMTCALIDAIVSEIEPVTKKLKSIFTNAKLPPKQINIFLKTNKKQFNNNIKALKFLKFVAGKEDINPPFKAFPSLKTSYRKIVKLVFMGVNIKEIKTELEKIYSPFIGGTKNFHKVLKMYEESYPEYEKKVPKYFEDKKDKHAQGLVLTDEALEILYNDFKNEYKDIPFLKNNKDEHNKVLFEIHTKKVYKTNPEKIKTKLKTLEKKLKKEKKNKKKVVLYN